MIGGASEASSGTGWPLSGHQQIVTELLLVCPVSAHAVGDRCERSLRPVSATGGTRAPLLASAALRRTARPALRPYLVDSPHLARWCTANLSARCPLASIIILTLHAAGSCLISDVQPCQLHAADLPNRAAITLTLAQCPQDCRELQSFATRSQRPHVRQWLQHL